MTDTRLTCNSAAPVLAALRERGIRIDPLYAGECRQLFGNAGVRANYCRRGGLSVDDVSELLLDRGFVQARLDGRETLDMLEQLLQPAPRRRRRRRTTVRTVDHAVTKATKMRMRKFQCPRCSQIARATTNAALLCGVCHEMHGELIPLSRIDPTPIELLESAAMELCS